MAGIFSMKNNNFKKILCTFIVAVLSIFMIPTVGAKTCRIVARVKCEPNTLQYKNVSEFIGKCCLLKIYKFGAGREYKAIRVKVFPVFTPPRRSKNY